MQDPGTDPASEDYGDFALRRFLGMEIDSPAAGEATARLTIADQHRNPNGVVHGAVLFAMVDTAMGAATMSVLAEGLFCASVDVQLRFLRSASAGTLTAEVTVAKRGRSIVHLDARVREGDDRVVATAAGTFAVIEP